MKTVVVVICPEDGGIRDLLLRLRSTEDEEVVSIDLPLLNAEPAWGIRITPSAPAYKTTFWDTENPLLFLIPDATCYLLNSNREQQGPVLGCAGTINTVVRTRNSTFGTFSLSPLED